MSDVKRIGHCTTCDKECYEIVQSFPLDHHPMKGHPRRLGKPLPHARQVEIGLSDGSYVSLLFCKDCAQDIDLEATWAKCCASNLWEHENREALGAKPLTPKQDAAIREDIAALSERHLTGIIAVHNIGEG